MVNTEYLESLISEKGLKKSFIASAMNIHINSLTNKLNNKTRFTPAEAEILFKLLDVTTISEKKKIFPEGRQIFYPGEKDNGESNT